MIRSPQAQADIDEIGDHIAADSVQNAVRWLMRLDRFKPHRGNAGDWDGAG